jgi:hypothetical protein
VDELAITVARHDERLTDIEDWTRDHERRQNGSLEKIHAELAELRRMYAGRPTWAVSLTITTLVGVVVALGTRLVLGG